MQPRISGHDVGDWHMHVTGRGSSASAEYLAGAIWGLAVWLCEYGSARFGVCADERCGNVYLDTSSNCCRRFCSERCATRSHVAAHRARKRAAGGRRRTPTRYPAARGCVRSSRGLDRRVDVHGRQVGAGEGERLGQVGLAARPGSAPGGC